MQHQGLVRLAANYRCRFGEIDLVMQDRAEGVLVFVEVRSRHTGQFLSPAESVDHRKQQRLALTANHFLLCHPRFANLPARFDVVAVTGSHYRRRFEWTRDAFCLDEVIPA